VWWAERFRIILTNAAHSVGRYMHDFMTAAQAASSDRDEVVTARQERATA
jgi:hypothetical protein